MSIKKKELHENREQDVIVDRRSLLTWLGTAIVLYCSLSGALIWLLPFGNFSQYSVIIHSVVGAVSSAPVAWLIYLHWQRRYAATAPRVGAIAFFATTCLALCLTSGIIITFQALFGTLVMPALRVLHLITGLLLGIAILLHLVPIFSRYRSTPPTARRPARRRFAVAGTTLVAVLFGVTIVFSTTKSTTSQFKAFSDDYEFPYGADLPFWPSRVKLADPPWREQVDDALAHVLSEPELRELQSRLQDWVDSDGGPVTALRESLASMNLDEVRVAALQAILENMQSGIGSTGSLVANTMTGARSCGASGCHESIYKEWLPSAHGYSATDILFVRVQALLAESGSVAQTRACAGCHDPVALLSGSRHGASIAGESLVQYEGNSCLVCHNTVSTDSNGNGGYVLQLPDRYLFAQNDSVIGRTLNHFLIRSYPFQHVDSFERPLYKSSEFCAACHKQTAIPGVSTSAGLAQEQNEYDSWRSSRWYHAEDEQKRIECRECHMPLVDSDDPARGDDVDEYRHIGDGKHRSHRMLASNMYIPAVQNIEGGERQAEMTIAWLRGEIDIPEITDKWVTGPVVEVEIEGPEEIAPGDLVNLKLHLYNNKTGHDFPAGPLDVLESWIELTVTDNHGNLLMQLGNENKVSPSLDAPVIYKADWYDRQGLPIEQHNLWEVVGASYKRALASGGRDIVDVPFRCPVIARPRVSESASEDGPGERKSDVVFSIENEAISELRVTARLLFRKANPQFLARIYDVEHAIEAPIVELNRATHVIRVRMD